MALLQNIVVSTSVLIFSNTPVAAKPVPAPSALPKFIKPIAALSDFKAAPAPQPLQPVYVPPPPPPAPQTFPFDLSANYPNTFAPNNCTSFVASKKHIPWGGNANMWAINARAAGYTVSPAPLVGAVAQTSRGAFGHVAIVTAVYPDHITIMEQNYDYRGSIRSRDAAYSEFIYIWI